MSNYNPIEKGYVNIIHTTKSGIIYYISYHHNDVEARKEVYSNLQKKVDEGALEITERSDILKKDRNNIQELRNQYHPLNRIKSKLI